MKSAPPHPDELLRNVKHFRATVMGMGNAIELDVRATPLYVVDELNVCACLARRAPVSIANECVMEGDGVKADSKAQLISVSLKADEIGLLKAVARQRGMTLEGLTHAWLRAGLEISGLAPATDGASMPSGTGTNQIEDQINQLRVLLQEHDDRLNAIETQLGNGNGGMARVTRSRSRTDRMAGRDDGNGTSHGDAPAPGRTRRNRRRDRRSGLHEEISAVLQEAGRPMGASEIAEAIRQRGRYAAPRSGNPVSGQMVSSRVSNPQYRDLFRRKDRKISLSK